MLDNELFMIELIKATTRGHVFKKVSDRLKNHPEVALKAVETDGTLMRFVSESLRANKVFVIEALSRCGFEIDSVYAINEVSEELQNDRDVVKAALKNQGGSYQYINEQFKNDRDILKIAITGGCTAFIALRDANNEFKNDEALVLEAINHDARAFQFASEELKGDRDIVMVAVNNWDQALSYVSEALRKNKEFVLDAMKQNLSCMRYAKLSIKTNLNS